MGYQLFGFLSTTTLILGVFSQKEIVKIIYFILIL